MYGGSRMNPSISSASSGGEIGCRSNRRTADFKLAEPGSCCSSWVEPLGDVSAPRRARLSNSPQSYPPIGVRPSDRRPGRRCTATCAPSSSATRARASPSKLPGYYPENGDEGVHVGNDMAVTDMALRNLKEEVEGIPSPTTIRRVREKLRLSQREAGGPIEGRRERFRQI